jgi:hypothetical protein
MGLRQLQIADLRIPLLSILNDVKMLKIKGTKCDLEV